jgi:hypothetical protein
MGWFFVEALLALVIAIVIVWWTMGPKRGKRSSAGDDDRGESR